MKWSQQAEEAVARVPFFVRKRVRGKVEEEAARHGAPQVLLEHVRACQQRFLGNMEEEVKGHRVETCFGSNGCPNRAVPDSEMARRIEETLEGCDLKAFLKARVQGLLKMHHEFRVSLSDCPNSCSRPQIVDIGLIGARKPALSQQPCSRCGSCVEVCREGAIRMPGSDSPGDAPEIEAGKCLSCGQCIEICPTGTLREDVCGYRILVGGKLGRHPQLGRELGRIFPPDEALQKIKECIAHYMKHNTHGERFGEILNRTGMEDV